jgi:purine-binding chemotaxis protein CheW
MSRDVALSSEQALDDYFSALLDEEAGELELVQEKQQERSPQVSQESHVVPQLQTQHVAEESGITQGESLIFPNLEDVQRLLNQMASSNPVDDIEDLAELLDRNTQEIAAHKEEILTAPVIEEEIQDWDIQSEAVIEVTEPESEAVILEKEPELVTQFIEEIQSVEEVQTVEEIQETVEEQVTLQTQTGGGDDVVAWHSTERVEDFQVLYFEVHGVTFAVPLDELGGIHRLEKVNHLIGKPGWYLGLQTNRDNQLDVVDTARWVMAEKLKDDSYKDAYQYIVMLGDSLWGLACDQLKGTELLNTEKIRWREQAGKRPWLAGMVKEKMCALIHVEALTNMLNAGLDVKALDNE